MGQCLCGESDYDKSEVVYKYQPYDWFGELSKEKEKPKETANSGTSLHISAQPNIDKNTVVFTASSTDSHHLDSISISLTMGQCTSAQSRPNGNSIEEEPYRVARRDKPYTRYKSRYEPYTWDIYVDTHYAKDNSNARKNRSRSLNSLRWDFYVEPEETQRKELLEVENEDNKPFSSTNHLNGDKTFGETSPPTKRGKQKVKKLSLTKLEGHITQNTEEKEEGEEDGEQEETPRKLIAEIGEQKGGSDDSDDEETKERTLKTASPPPRYSDVVTKTTAVIKYDNVPRPADKTPDKDREPPEKEKSTHETQKMDAIEYLDLRDLKSSPNSGEKVGKPEQPITPITRDVDNHESDTQYKQPNLVGVSRDKPLFKAPETMGKQTKPSKFDNNIRPVKAHEIEKEQANVTELGNNDKVTEAPNTKDDLETKSVQSNNKKCPTTDLETKHDPTKPASLSERDRLIDTEVPRTRNGLVMKEKPVITIESRPKTLPPQTTKADITPRRNSLSDLGTRPEKNAVKETVLIPTKFPQLFTGKRHAWRGLLLFGPAGSGKASLATAVAKEIGHSYCTLQTFMTLNSYSGNAVTAMFKKARENVPHVIIIDHLEGLSASEIRELHKQMKSSTEKEFEGLLVVGISDCPWTLDKSVVELFEKRIFITLPSAASRAELFRENFEKTQHNLTEEDFIELGAWSEGYSCADIITVVNETLMQSVRKIQDATYFKKVNSRDVVNSQYTDMFTPCSPGENGAIEMDWTQVPEKKLLEPAIRLCDVLVALRTQKPSLKQEDVEKHKQFARKFTQHGNNTVV